MKGIPDRSAFSPANTVQSSWEVLQMSPQGDPKAAGLAVLPWMEVGNDGLQLLQAVRRRTRKGHQECRSTLTVRTQDRKLQTATSVSLKPQLSCSSRRWNCLSRVSVQSLCQDSYISCLFLAPCVIKVEPGIPFPNCSAFIMALREADVTKGTVTSQRG